MSLKGFNISRANVLRCCDINQTINTSSVDVTRISSGVTLFTQKHCGAEVAISPVVLFTCHVLWIVLFVFYCH